MHVLKLLFVLFINANFYNLNLRMYGDKYDISFDGAAYERISKVEAFIWALIIDERCKISAIKEKEKSI